MARQDVLQDVLFLDIETVPFVPRFGELGEEWQRLWEEKSQYFRERNDQSVEESYARAGIYAEFGRVICIGVAYFQSAGEECELRVSGFCEDDEESTLRAFSLFLTRTAGKPFRRLCAHNGKEFDFPYLCRRMLINGVPLPPMLRIAGRKPWEIPHLDTMELWKFGDYKHYTSLKLLAAVFGIPSPKGDMDGSQVADVFWKDRDIRRIVSYCRKDVITLARVYQRLSGLNWIQDEHVVEVENIS